jgi:hypothetical protein
MNFIRTNQTLHIGQLIGQAMLPFNSGIATSVSNGTSHSTLHAKNQNFKVEGDGPVRPAERVPYSPSHKLPEILVSDRSASSVASVCPGTTDTPEVAAA